MDLKQETNDIEIKRTLEKQLQILSEHSQDKSLASRDLAEITRAMCDLVNYIVSSKLDNIL